MTYKNPFKQTLAPLLLSLIVLGFTVAIFGRNEAAQQGAFIFSLVASAAFALTGVSTDKKQKTQETYVLRKN